MITMKITFSRNINDIGCAIEANKEAAEKVFKEYPEFKQVTLDTMTDEDRKMMEMAEKKGGAA